MSSRIPSRDALHGSPNARLSPAGRLLLCQRIEAGTPIAHVAAAMGISRQCASKWWGRWREFGPGGLEDRPCTPVRRARIAPRVEYRIVYLRRSRRWGPDRIAAYLGQPRSTVHRVLVRHRMNRLDRLDGQTGRVSRRYERAAPGELVALVSTSELVQLGVPRGGRGRCEQVVLGQTQVGAVRDEVAGLDFWKTWTPSAGR